MDKHAFMRACREGGQAIEEALRALDRACFAVLYRDCRRSLRDPEAARDLVQETFIRVWQRCASFRGDSDVLPWVRSILRHAVLDRLKRPEREVPMAGEDDRDDAWDRAIAALSHGRPHAGEEAERRERAACFARCWKRFEEAAPAHAAVMTWIVEDGLDNEQIAALLGRTPGATREFVSQCRKRARLHLAEWYALLAAAREPA